MLVCCFFIFIFNYCINFTLALANIPHIPKLDSMQSFMGLITLCFLVIAGNILDPRTYRYLDVEPNGTPTADDVDKMKHFDLNDMDAGNRMQCSYARGITWRIIQWIEDSYEMYGTVDLMINAIILSYFTTLSKKILLYKRLAQNANIQGVTNCTYELLEAQIDLCFDETAIKTEMD